MQLFYTTLLVAGLAPYIYICCAFFKGKLTHPRSISALVEKEVYAPLSPALKELLLLLHLWRDFPPAKQNFFWQQGKRSINHASHSPHSPNSPHSPEFAPFTNSPHSPNSPHLSSTRKYQCPSGRALSKKLFCCLRPTNTQLCFA